MPIFFQHQINENTRLGIWKIEETEEFFKGNVPLHREVTHPHKRLQHLAGRFLLQFLFPDFPYQLIEIADTRKPFLPDEQYHFSISHCGDYAAAIVSRNKRVGVDIEIPVEKIGRIMYKYLSAKEHSLFNLVPGGVGNSALMNYNEPTLLWSAKEAVFKWYGNGGVDFRREIQLQQQHEGTETIDCLFAKNDTALLIHYRHFDGLVLAWVIS
ncbi:MAG: 4'-phosphopantetheinyl transferase superfamily protein [Bacteroidota bacterium]|nr:4'-phosphopantetheinyl transferase superfamily protein [Bacteroidota bacterium]